MTNGGFGFISIHAPVKGATRVYNSSVCLSRYFNPRTREGCDYEEAALWQLLNEFQSTHP